MRRILTSTLALTTLLFIVQPVFAQTQTPDATKALQQKIF
jgi:hypothetical protein